MEHPELNWLLQKAISEDRERQLANPTDTGIAFASRKALGRAFIAIGTRLTPAPAIADRRPLELPKTVPSNT